MKNKSQRTRIMLAMVFSLLMGPLAAVQGWATTYYISSSGGNDANNGTSASTPWQHLEMVSKKCWSGHTFQPGDNILLNRGDTFTEKLFLENTNGTLAAPIIIGAYGTGAMPILYGDSRAYVWHPVSDLGVTGHAECYYADIGYRGCTAKSFSGTNFITRIYQANPLTGVTDNLSTVTGISNFCDRLYQSWWDVNYNPSHPTSPVTLTSDVCGPDGGAPGRAFIRTANGQSPVYGQGTGQIKLFYTSVEVSSCSYVIVEDLDLRECSYACSSIYDNYVTVRRLNVQDVLGIGVYIGQHSSNVSVLDSTVTRTANDAIYFINDQGPYRNCLVRGNDISHRTDNILGYITTGEKALGFANVDGLVFEYNYVHDNDKGAMDWYWANNVTVRYNFLYNNLDAFGSAHGTNFRVHDNVVIATPANNSRGILITPTGDSTSYVYNNTFYGLNQNGNSGIGCLSGSGYNVHTYVFNNIVHLASNAPAAFRYVGYDNPAQVTSFNNCFYGWATPRWIVSGTSYTTFASYVATGVEKHSLNADPLFVNSSSPTTAADLMLQANSPCLDAGAHPKVVAAVDPSGDIAEDYNGVIRHFGQAVDIGAFEAAGTGTSTLSNGLVLSTHFDEAVLVPNQATVIDASGNNYHGTPVGGVTTGTNGKLDGTINLNGVDGSVPFGTLGSWNPTEFTISFWFKDTGCTQATELLNGKFDVRYNTLGNDSLELIVYGSQQMTSVYSPANITPGVWHHVVCTYSDSGDRKAYIYVDGVGYTADTALADTMTSMANATFLLGNKYDASYQYPKAQFDELNVWNRVLTATEIANLYNAGSGLVVKAPDTYPIQDKSSPNFQRVAITPFGPGSTATVTPEDKGATLRITGDGWVQIPYAYTVTAKTVLSFDCRTTALGDIHAIGMDTDNTLDAGKTFQIDGTVAYGIAAYAYNYSMVEPGWQHYDIPIGTYYTGTMQNIFFGNKMASGSPECKFSNIVVREQPNTVIATSQDTTTKGAWKWVTGNYAKYGADGYDIRGTSASLPSYATVAYPDGTDLIWAATTTDVRGLQKPNPATDRIAACRYSATTETIDLTINPGIIRNVSIYVLDWDNQGRSMTVDALDGDTGTILQTQSVSAFSGGIYLKYTVKGHIKFRFTNTAGPNAVFSGLFFE